MEARIALPGTADRPISTALPTAVVTHNVTFARHRFVTLNRDGRPGET